MHADGAEMLLPADAFGLEIILDRRYRTERDLLLTGGGVDIEIVNVRELRALVREKAEKS